MEKILNTILTIYGAPSYRRHLLDALLNLNKRYMTGDVIDLGGKKIKTRGCFVPPTEGIRTWISVNLDSTVAPDILADVCKVPLSDSSFDNALLIEVLEHLHNPLKCLQETQRLLRPHGTLYMSVPFLYPVHGDPQDFQRWTLTGLKRLLTAAGFEVITIYAMGGALGTIGNLIDVSGDFFLRPTIRNRIVRRCLRLLGRMMCSIEQVTKKNDVYIPGAFTTGYFIISRKSLEQG